MPASGKSTLAKKLSDILNIEKYDFDDIKFEKKFDIERTENKQVEIIKEILGKDSWIVEGALREPALPFWKNADLVIFLQISEFTPYKRIIFRYLKKLLSTKEKTVGSDFILLKRIYNYFHKPNNFLSLKKYQEYLKKYAKNYIIIKNNKDIQDLLKDTPI